MKKYIIVYKTELLDAGNVYVWNDKLSDAVLEFEESMPHCEVISISLLERQ